VAPADTPEALMRSRYSAFAKGLVDYLAKTTTKEMTGQARAELEAWTKAVRWLGLTVKEAKADEVSFEARYLEGDRLGVMTERSKFVQHEGRWLYVDGVPSGTQRKVERNEPCPCGSGKKFKSCHA
jgi:SEC-C motif domain protein